MDTPVFSRTLITALAAVLLQVLPLARAADTPPLIPIRFHLDQPGQVTLVIEDEDGKRVRNLVSQQPFEAGDQIVWWDGLDDRDRDVDAAKHAVFHIPGKLVAPGRYTVRGLAHPEIDLVYLMTPYTHGNPPWRTSDPGSQWLTNHSAPSDVIFLPAGAAPEREDKPTSKGGQIIICSRVAEGGSGLAWVDMDGRKLWGQHWLGGVWTAASHLAVDRGERPVEGTYAYAAASWQGDKYNQFKPELRLHKLVDAGHRVMAPRDRRFGTGEDRPVLEPTYEIPLMPGAVISEDDRQAREDRRKYTPTLTGLAVHNGLVVCSFAMLDKVLFVDAHAGRALGLAAVPSPHGLAFDRQGRLFALSGGRVVRFELDAADPTRLPAPVVLVEGLEDPQYITVAADGTIYVSDWGQSHQVKVFADDGEALGAIGDPGPPSLGPYNPNHLNHPAGMALDDRGRLWVAENTHIPKRVSIWNLNGRTLADAFYGPMRYGGSGAVDPVDKTRFFYDDDHGGTIEFKLDYATGKSTPTSIVYLDEYNQSGLKGRYVGAAPSYPLHHGGFLYLTDCYSQSTSGRRSSALWRLDKDGIARVVAAAGNIQDSSSNLLPAFDTEAMRAAMPEGFSPEKGKALLFVWSDANGDQQLQPAEVQFLDPKTHAAAGSRYPPWLGTVTVTDDLAFTLSSVGDDVMRISPAEVSAAGVPRYDLGKAEVLATGTQRPASSGGNQVLPAANGWLITTTPVQPFAREGLGAVRDGEPIWSYPSLWPGLHASHISPLLDEPGQLVGTTRLIGPVIDAPPGSEAGQLWAINANKGTIYVFTTDGLFVTRLFKDSRTASWNAPEATPGMLVNDLSLHEECFGPIWTRTTDGEVLLQAFATGNIMQVKNLDKIKRLPDQAVEVSAEQLQTAQQWQVEQEARRQAAAADQAKPLQAAMLTTAPVIDGKTDDWPGAQWVTIDVRKQSTGDWSRRDSVTQATLAVSGDTLYAAWRTHDQGMLRSSGESLNNLFKTGGALDLMLATNPDAPANRRTAAKGDLRVLITQVKGKTVAVLYEPVHPGAAGEPVEFGSPLRTLHFDRVDVISDRIQLAATTETDLKADKNGKMKLTTYEVAIPLALLGFKPEPGKSYRGDLGVLRGDGNQTLQRVYWHNKAANMVSDIPSEAELLPALWGTIEFGTP